MVDIYEALPRNHIDQSFNKIWISPVIVDLNIVLR